MQMCFDDFWIFVLTMFQFTGRLLVQNVINTSVYLSNSCDYDPSYQSLYCIHFTLSKYSEQQCCFIAAKSIEQKL